MRLLIGIDKQRRFETALRLLKGLGFEQAEWHFAHFVSVIDSESPSNVNTGSEAAGVLQAYLGESPESDALVDEITTELAGKVHLLKGSPAKSLMALAEKIGADIVGLGSVAHGAIGAALLGSVGRAFAIGSDRSFLVGRGDFAKTGKLKVVFATDYSDYADRALKAFLAMKPKSVESIVLVTAHELMETSEIAEHITLFEEAKTGGRTHEEHLRNLGEQSVKVCSDAGIPATAELRNGFVSGAIDDAVEEHRADLVVLGAQGHGFLERILIGSSALHQIITSEHSTLVIRTRR